MPSEYCVLCETDQDYKCTNFGAYLYCECPICIEYFIEPTAQDRFKKTVTEVTKEFSKKARSADDGSILVITAIYAQVPKGCIEPRVNAELRNKDEIKNNSI